MRGARTNWVLICILLAACNALDEPPTRLSPGTHLIVPTDERPAVQALRTPPPIIGGTLAITQDGQLAIVADPERDRISIVDLTTAAVQEIALVASEQRHVENWRRRGAKWEVEDLIGDSALVLETVGVTIPFATIFADSGV